jgi:hypothetical protein
MRNLERKFRKKYPDLANLAIREEPDRLVIGADNEDTAITILDDEGNWEVDAKEGHGHVDSIGEGMELAATLLRGEARFTQEYRGDKHSAGWIELPEGDEFVLDHLAIYTSPFDPDEWQLWEGETWRQIRTVRQVAGGSKIEVDSWEIEAEQGVYTDGEQLSWLTDGLGPADPGMKWITRGSAFVFQCLQGWRKRLDNDSLDWDDYSPKSGDLILRAYTWFRDAEMPTELPVGNAVWPGSVEYMNEGEQDGWQCSKWSIHFSDGQGEMLGYLELFVHDDAEVDCEALVRQVDRASRKSIYVSGDWIISNVVPSHPELSIIEQEE